MTEQQAKLRKAAMALRLKAHTGQVAVAAARDVAAVLPRELAAVVSRAIESGDLAKRWADELEKARKARVFPDGGPEQETAVALAAVTALLAWHGQEARRIALAKADAIEGDRRHVEGRAAGIEEALGLLCVGEPAAPESLNDGEHVVPESTGEVPQR